VTCAKLRQKTHTQKHTYQSAKNKHFLNFHARKTFFQAHTQSGIDYVSTFCPGLSKLLFAKTTTTKTKQTKLSHYTGEQSK